MKSYLDYVSELERLALAARALPLGGVAPLTRPAPAPDARCAVIFAPHPDDECIIGGLALRLQREAGLRVVSVAVTQGSDKARQAPRFLELRAACAYLGFELVATQPGGLLHVNPQARAEDRAGWSRSVAVISDILARLQPAALFLPHEGDWNSTHVGTHHLVMDALALQPASFASAVVETEYWGAMATPNLMVELAREQVAELVTALSFHVEEVRRNAYHVTLPAWLIDNVRRGSELVGGQGGASPDFLFATLYRVRQWSGGRLHEAPSKGVRLPSSENARDVLTPR